MKTKLTAIFFHVQPVTWELIFWGRAEHNSTFPRSRAAASLVSSPAVVSWHSRMSAPKRNSPFPPYFPTLSRVGAYPWHTFAPISTLLRIYCVTIWLCLPPSKLQRSCSFAPPPAPASNCTTFPCSKRQTSSYKFLRWLILGRICWQSVYACYFIALRGLFEYFVSTEGLRVSEDLLLEPISKLP